MTLGRQAGCWVPAYQDQRDADAHQMHDARCVGARLSRGAPRRELGKLTACMHTPFHARQNRSGTLSSRNKLVCNPTVNLCFLEVKGGLTPRHHRVSWGLDMIISVHK